MARLMLAILMLVDVALLLYLSRHVTFYLDEWRIVTQRRDWHVDTFLDPHNEHLFLIPVAVFKLLMVTVGLGHHWAFELPLFFLHLLSVLLVYLLARRRLGEWPALAASALILFLGSAWEDLLLPIQVSFLGSVAAGLAMLLVLDHPSTRLRDCAASLLLVLSIASSTLGLSFAAAALVEVLGRPNVRRRLWLVGIPLALYAVWFIAYGPRRLQQNGSLQTNIPAVPKYVAEAVAGALGAVSGLGLDWGRVMALVALVVVARHFLRVEQAPLRLVSVLVAGLSFWLLSGLARAHLNDPAAVRYLYPGGVFVVLGGVELVPSRGLGRRGAVIVAASVAFAVVANMNALRSGRDTLEEFSDTVLAQLAALEVANRVRPDFTPAPDLAPSLRAGSYFDTVRDLGSPIDVRRDLLQQSNTHRREADSVLVRALELKARVGGSVDRVAQPPSVDEVHSGRADRGGTCIRFKPTGRAAALDVTSHGAALLVRTSGGNGAEISLRRFADEFGSPAIRVRPDATELIALPRTGPAIPWRVRLSTRRPLRVCTGAASESR